MNKNGVVIKDNSAIKKRNDRILELYDYLDSRGFDNYPEVTYSDENTIHSKYINKSDYYELKNGEEFIKTVALLHSKTIKYKETSKSKYKEINEMISGNIEYLKEYYENMISNIEEEEYMSPSHYLLARNYFIINDCIKQASRNLKIWFNKVQ